MSNPSKTHCDVLDLIRALAAGAVCVSHLRNLAFTDYNPGLNAVAKAFYFVSNFGHTAVIVFFILSGYFVGGSVLRQVEAGTWSPQTYLRDRLSRLWIVLIPALLLTCFWDQMGLAMAGGPFYLGTEGTFDQRINVADHLGTATFFCNVGFLQTLACGTYGSNGALWSLANEFWYYLWFPSLYVFVRHWRSLYAQLAFVLTVALMVAFPSILGGFAIWLFGAAIAYLVQRFPRRTARTGRAWLSWSTGTVFVISLAVTRLQHTGDWLAGITCFMFVASILWEEVRLTNARISRAAVLFSGFSYSLYLTHVPIILFFAATVLGRRIELNTSGVLIFCAALAACYLYAYGVYFLFERNTRRVQRALVRLQPFKAKSARSS